MGHPFRENARVNHPPAKTGASLCLKEKLGPNRMSKLASIGYVGKLLVLTFVLISPAAVAAQCAVADRQKAAIRANARTSRIDTAEVGSAPTWAIDSDAYRCQQPDVYWHDKDWNIDLLLPTAENDPFSLKIRARSGQEKILKLDGLYMQIASISLAPNDEALVVGYAYGSWSGQFSVAEIVNLKSGTQLDQVVASTLSISPNRRFLIFLNGDQTNPVYDYRLYDLLKSPRENTCGYRDNDPHHKDFDEEYRGIPLYPKTAHQIGCSEADQKPFEDEDHQRASNYLWSADSSKVIFADVNNRKIVNIIEVTMPSGPKDTPHELIYRPDPGKIHWSNLTSSDEEPIHLSWDSESEDAVSILARDSSALIIQISKFVRLE
jgi:hypothetical protein